MTTPFIDTDVIIRFLTSDDMARQADAARLFQLIAAGRLVVTAPLTVVADAVYVLSSPRLYAVPRATISRLLTPLLRLAGLRIRHRRAVLRALGIYGSTNLDFGDAMIVAEMERAHAQIVCSYDSHFDRIGGIRRVSPAELVAADSD